MEKNELISIIESETSKKLSEDDMKLRLYEVGIDSFKLIRIVFEVEKKYNVRLSSIFENDEKFESVGDFIDKLQNEIKITK